MTAAQAEATLGQIEQQIAQWTAEAETADKRLAELRAAAGDQALADPGRAAEIASALAEASGAAEVARAAAETAGGKLDPARRQVLRARAGELRQRAGRLRTVADSRWAKTRKLLDQLREWEGTSFVHYLPPDRETINRHEGVTPRYGTTYGRVEFRKPTTLAIRGEADQLDHSADQLDQLAASGTDTEVGNKARQPLPAPSPVEREHG